MLPGSMQTKDAAGVFLFDREEMQESHTVAQLSREAW